MAHYDDDWLEIDLRRREYGRDERPHTGAGLAALACAALAMFGAVSVFAATALMDSMELIQGPDEDLLLGVLLLAYGICFLLALAGIILGFVGISQPHRNPLLGVLGTILNGFLLMGILCTGLAHLAG
jgi:hypothetical protein